MKIRNKLNIGASAEREVSTKPVRNRLLIPLVVVLLLLGGGFRTSLLYIQKQNIAEKAKNTLERATDKFYNGLAEQSDELDGYTEILANDPRLKDALKRQDRQALLDTYDDLFLHLREEHNLTHFYFHRPDRVNLLRVHKPGKNGDLINRFTALEAERTGQTAFGIELGPLGTFTLRTVTPVYDGDVLIGYIELGKEIEDVLVDISADKNLEVIATIHKDVLNRAKWEAGMEMLGRDNNWNQFEDIAIIYSSFLSGFPDKLESFMPESAHIHEEITAEVKFDKHDWLVLISPLIDVSSIEVGDLMILLDISEDNATFYRFLFTGAGLTFVVLAILFGFLYTILQRTDRGIYLQQQYLQSSKDRFDQLAEQSNTVIWEVDENGLYTYISNVVHKVLGYKPDELVGHKHFYDIHPEEERKEFKTAALEIFAQKEQFERMRNVIQAKDGNIKWVSTNGIPLLNDDGTLLGYRGSDTDITEQKQAEEALQESEAKFRVLYESSSDAVMLLDEKGFFDCNVATVQIFGCKDKEEFCSKHPVDFSPPFQPDGTDSMKVANEQIKKAMEEGSRHFEWMHRRINGEDFFAEVLLNATELKGRKVIQAVVRDITERKCAEEQLRASEERFKSILNTVQAGIVIIEEKTHEILFANPAAATMVQTSIENMVGKVCHEFICPTELGKCPISDLGNKIDSSEKKLLKVDGEELDILKTVNPIKINGIKCLIETFVDITDMKQAKEQLANNMESLREAKEIQEENNAKLVQTMADLERFNDMAVGRELRMIELKKEVNSLLLNKGSNAKYSIPTDTDMVEDLS